MSKLFLISVMMGFSLVSFVVQADIISNPGDLCVTDTRENSSCGAGENKATQNLDGGFPGEGKKSAYLKDHPEGLVKNDDAPAPQTPVPEGSTTK